MVSLSRIQQKFKIKNENDARLARHQQKLEKGASG